MLPRGYSPESLAVRTVRGETGMDASELPTLIAVEDRRVERPGGARGQDIVLLYALASDAKLSDDSGKYVWVKTQGEMEARSDVAPKIKEAIIESGVFSGDMRGPTEVT
jgi:hypothetical protein